MKSRALVIGSSGLLGRAVAHRLGSTGVRIGPIDWASDRERDSIAAAVHSLVKSESLHLVWCAGQGSPLASDVSCARETLSLRNLTEVLDDRAIPIRSLTFASSAGALYGGELTASADTITQPTTHYGLMKLDQERLCLTWSQSRSIPVQILRLSTLYGPGQSPSKPQGLVTASVRSTLRRVPLVMRVSLESVRDLLFSGDAANMICDSIGRLESGRELPPLRILASGQSVSVAHILSEVKRVTGRKPLLSFAPTSTERSPGAGSFVVDDDVRRHARTLLADGIHQVMIDELMATRHGLPIPA